MTITTGTRLLPISPAGTIGAHGRASRDPLTCLHRCGNACDGPEPNRTDNPHVRDEITHAIRRRSLLAGAAVGSGAIVLGGLAESAVAAPPTGPSARGTVVDDLGRTSFRSVPPNRRDGVSTAEGFTSSVVMRWGDPVMPGAPRFDVRNQSVESARMQFGFNCDYVGVLPLPGDDALMVVNHEYTTGTAMFPTGVYEPAQQLAIEMANHGMSVVRIKRGATPGSWKQNLNLKVCRENRRIHLETAFGISGPAAGDERLRTTADPTGRFAKGTLNNCAGGFTPWGTVLSGEENFNQYFDATDGLDERYTAQYARYGIVAQGRGWSAIDPRFDLSKEPHEPHRFGWIVEVDPYSPNSRPRKHSMLGRFKHEGADVVISTFGKAVAYMGDDERGDYLYKFVSADKFDPAGTPKAKKHNMTLLTKGTLYVARLKGDGATDGTFDGTGRWIKMCTDTQSFVPGMSVADVLIFTRLAADTLSATKMDRPEDVECNRANGKVYAAMTNNSNRGSASQPVDEANPLATSMVRATIGAPLTPASGNRNGYVLELVPGKENHGEPFFTWNLMLVCGDPDAPETFFAGFDKNQVSPISCPDNVSWDSAGNLWISTDGNVLGSNDGIFRVPTAGPERGRVQQFLTVPRGAEACGPLITEDAKSLFFAVQHPGELSGATFEAPASTWPHTDDFPRPSVCVAYRDK